MSPHRGRENAGCPGCGSLERHRILWLFLQRETQILRDEVRLLHLAPEPILTSRLRQCAGIRYESGDVEPGKAMEVMDITDLPCATDSFDVVLCNHVLEHVPEDRAAMSEIRRVLKVGGVALMQHPIDEALPRTYENWAVKTPEARLAEFGQEDHVRVYGNDFDQRLKDAGFQITRRRYIDELDASLRNRYALRDGDSNSGMRGADIYSCVKKLVPDTSRASDE